MNTTNPLSLVIYLLCLSFLYIYDRQLDSSMDRIICYPSACISGIFSFFTCLGGFEAIASGLDNIIFKAAVSILSFIGFGLLYYFLVRLFFYSTKEVSVSYDASYALGSIYKKLPVIAFFICIICWLPAFLTNYPGILTIDSINQYGQAIGAIAPSNHHPFFHTLMIKMCVSIGEHIKSATLGIAIYSLLQMCFSALVVSFLISSFTLFRIKKAWIWITIAFFSIVPFEGYMMATLWKDIPFSMSLLLLSTCLLRLCSSNKHPDAASLLTKILYIISGIGVGLFRSNGFYILICLIPLSLLVFRKKLIWGIVLNLIMLLCVLGVKYPLYRSLEVAEPAFVENLSIPLQTMGRVFVEGRASVDETKAWNCFLDVDAIPDYYYANVSDNMKSLVKMGNPEYLDSHKKEFILLWLETGMHHPAQYLTAWSDITRGYWYPDTLPENPIAGDEGIIANDYGLTASPILRGSLFVKIKELLFKLPGLIPLWGLLFSIGAFVWLMILMSGKILYNRQYMFLICILPSLVYLLTVFLAIPVGCEFRYGYEFIVCGPLYICAAFLTNPDAK